MSLMKGCNMSKGSWTLFSTALIYNIPLVLMLNHHFWKYYVPSRDWTPLQPIRLIWDIIYSHPCSKLPFIFSLFTGRTTEQGERNAYVMISLHSPTDPPMGYHSPHPPHITLIPVQGSNRRTSRRFTSLRAAGGIPPLHFAKFTHLVLTLIL